MAGGATSPPILRAAARIEVPGSTSMVILSIVTLIYFLVGLLALFNSRCDAPLYRYHSIHPFCSSFITSLSRLPSDGLLSLARPLAAETTTPRAATAHVGAFGSCRP